MEDPPKKFFRLGPGREVRLKHAYYISGTDFIKNENGDVTEIYCTYDPATKGGWSDDGRKVRGTLHWVSAKHAVDADVRLYDHLFNVENPETDGDDFIRHLNPDSLIIINQAKLERSLLDGKHSINYQFLRNGYFCLDPDSMLENLIFNKTVGLRDSWSKKQKTK
jgi:glutaminyl-tRNA synthetase